MKPIIHILIFIAAIVVPIFKFYNHQFYSHIIGDGNDNLLVLTILEKNLINFNALGSNLNIHTLYSSNAFYPYIDTNLFTEPKYFPSVIYGILKLLLQNQAAAFNSLFIFASVLNFYSFFYMSRKFKLELEIGILGSLIYANGHFFIVQSIHLQNQFAFGFPIVFGLLLQYKAYNKIKILALISVTLILQFFSCNYYGLFLFYFFFLSILITKFRFNQNVTKNRIVSIITSKRFITLYVPILCFLFFVGMIYYPFFKNNQTLFPQRIIEENIIYSNSLFSLITLPKDVNTFTFYNLTGSTHTSVHFGLIPIIILFLLLIKHNSLNRRTLIYLIFGIFFYFLSLGPIIKIFNVDIPGPYSIFYHIFPGFKSIRVPSRIFILSWFFITLTLISIAQIKKNKIHQNVYKFLLLLIVAELSLFTKISQKSELFFPDAKIINQLSQKSNVLFLNWKNDLLQFDNTSLPEWYLLNTQIKTPNGYTGITLPFQYYLINLLHNYQNDDLFYHYLHQLSITHLAVSNNQPINFNDERQTNQIKLPRMLKPILVDNQNNIHFYEIVTKKVVKVSSPRQLEQVPFHFINASIQKKTEYLTDKNTKTFWKSFSSGFQSSNDYLTIKLDREINQNLIIKLHSGPYIDRLPYGMIVTCKDKHTEYNLIPVNVNQFLKNPITSVTQEIEVETCNSNILELRVKNETPYAILMLSEIEVYKEKM